MPINQLPEWYAQKTRYENAISIPEKMIELKKLISMTRKHKSTEKLMEQLHTKLAKLQEQKEKEKKAKKRGGGSMAVPKEGFQLTIMGFPNSGKSTFLKKMTNANPEIADYPFTTKKPEVGMMNYEGGQVQLVEVPALTDGKVQNEPELMAIAHSSDGIIMIVKSENEEKILKQKLKDYLIQKSIMVIQFGQDVSKKQIFEFFKLIRVYTKEPGKKPEMSKPILLKEGSNILDAARGIHKDFADNLKYACVWGSAKFAGQRVEKNYKLKDGDVVEFHI